MLCMRGRHLSGKKRSIAFIILMKNFRIPQKKKTCCVLLNSEGLCFHIQSLTYYLTHIMFADVCIINEQMQLSLDLNITIFRLEMQT